MNLSPRLVLASGSPRRQEILAALGYTFAVRPADIDESRRAGEGPLEYVRRLAEEKSRAEARRGEIVLAADTIVAIDGDLLGKPSGPDDAAAMLERLSDREHEVSTGVAVLAVDAGRIEIAVETTRVRFAALSVDEIRGYVASGEPMGKAGAYAIQGLASLFVESIAGNYSNVVGLPVPRVYRMLLRAGAALPAVEAETWPRPDGP